VALLWRVSAYGEYDFSSNRLKPINRFSKLINTELAPQILHQTRFYVFQKRKISIYRFSKNLIRRFAELIHNFAGLNTVKAGLIPENKNK
jgi:hypothetical protein